MLSPLPRVYEEGHSGQAVPSEPEPSMIGGDVQVERLTSAAQETKKRLDIEVIQPIKQWMVAYRTIAVRVGSGGSARRPVAACWAGQTPNRRAQCMLMRGRGVWRLAPVLSPLPRAFPNSAITHYPLHRSA